MILSFSRFFHFGSQLALGCRSLLPIVLSLCRHCMAWSRYARESSCMVGQFLSQPAPFCHTSWRKPARTKNGVHMYEQSETIPCCAHLCRYVTGCVFRLLFIERNDSFSKERVSAPKCFECLGVPRLLFYVCALHIFAFVFCPTSKLFVVFGDFLSAWQHHWSHAPLVSEWGLTVFASLPCGHEGSVFLFCFICLPAPAHTWPVRFLHGLLL